MSSSFVIHSAPTRLPGAGSVVRKRTAAGVPRWVRRVATAVALAPLPSMLWRLPLAFGASMGFGPVFLDNLHVPGWGSLYVVLLGLASEVLALLCLGLVLPWGERWPTWLPRLGGRRVPIAALAAPAALGSVVLTLFAVGYVATSVAGDPHGPSGVSMWVMHVCYLPMLAWGPLLAVLTAHYCRRRVGSLRAVSKSASVVRRSHENTPRPNDTGKD